MAERKAFVLRVNPETLRAIERWAADEFRSTNGQIEWILDKALSNHRRTNNKMKARETEPGKPGSTRRVSQI